MSQSYMPVGLKDSGSARADGFLEPETRNLLPGPRLQALFRLLEFTNNTELKMVKKFWPFSLDFLSFVQAPSRPKPEESFHKRIAFSSIPALSWRTDTNPNAKKPDAASDPRKQTAPQAPAFDKLQVVRSLKNAEFGDKQAVTLVETIRDTQNELATKADSEKTGTSLRSDMKKMELRIRSDIEKMDLGLRGEIEKLRLDMHVQMKSLSATLSWRLLLGAGVMTAICSAVVTLAR